MEYHAHTKSDSSGTALPPTTWEPLFSSECGVLGTARCGKCETMHPDHGHLNKVASTAGRFAYDMFASGSREAEIACKWAALAGFWHDLGKYSNEFQQYLLCSSQPDVHQGEITHKVDHATAGAQYAFKNLGQKGLLLAHVIAGHHTGLLNWHGEGGMRNRLDKSLKPFQENADSLVLGLIKNPPPIPPLPNITDRNAPDAERQAAFRVAFWIRMLFSTLVDADFLSTEAFTQPRKAKDRPNDSIGLVEMQKCLTDRLDKLTKNAAPTPVNRQRKLILDTCREKALISPGFFSLCAPTGGGKTLAGLDFALRHAVKYNKRRIIVAIPFTSIIDQTAKEYRKVFLNLEKDLVLEHHCNLDPDSETDQSRLRSENWDAPLIVTTNVQLLESLFACKPGRCRKLHRIAGSVIILDEVQTLPVELLKPTLWALRELAEVFNCSIVLSSATQPAVKWKEGFSIGLRGVREIISAPEQFHQSLKRTQVEYIGKQTVEEIADRLLGYSQGLVIVNIRKDAAILAEKIGFDEGHFHLSTLMCAAHREAVIETIRRRLKNGTTCRVVSTQLIEAGVDLDFPVVFRASCGLDSLTQAAGRCNREGKLEIGEVYAFDFPEQPPPGHLRHTAETANEILAGLDSCDDPLSPSVLTRYFEQYYWKNSHLWDHHCVLDSVGNQPSQMQFAFEEIAKKYRLIPKSEISVFVPGGDLSLDACSLDLQQRPGTEGERIRDKWFYGETTHPPPREIWRKIQRLCVQLYQDEFNRLKKADALELRHEQYILIRQDLYDVRLGLCLERSDSAIPPEYLHV